VLTLFDRHFQHNDRFAKRATFPRNRLPLSSEIAVRCGFRDPRRLCIIFARYTGRTLGEYHRAQFTTDGGNLYESVNLFAIRPLCCIPCCHKLDDTRPLLGPRSPSLVPA
jgi:hypothetical protein